MMIKISKDFYIDSGSIDIITDYARKNIKAKIRKMKNDDKVLDLSGTKKTLGVIFLKNGEAILTDTSHKTILKRCGIKDNTDEEETT